ncbi:MAG: response regulator [Chloroflexi bacterium]|nr:response regulator [Chloroflexota bacterium]
MDAIDRQIIALLQTDGRMSNVDIARTIGVAEATVRKRIDRLLSEGLVRVVAMPAVDRLGLEVETVIMLKVDLGQVARIGEQLAAMKEVRSVKYTTGEYDIILEAVFPSDEDLLRFLTSRLARIQGIRATATSHVLKNVKQSSDWILPREGPPLILIVDDDPDFVEASRIVLETAGYQVISATSGEQGLRAMRQARPDLVILDVMMSGILDGLDASMRMKTERDLRRTPVLMISSITTSDYAAMFPTDEYVPVENFLSKPVSPNQLLAEVKRLLE